MLTVSVGVWQRFTATIKLAETATRAGTGARLARARCRSCDLDLDLVEAGEGETLLAVGANELVMVVEGDDDGEVGAIAERAKRIVHCRPSRRHKDQRPVRADAAPGRRQLWHSRQVRVGRARYAGLGGDFGQVP